MLAGARFRRLLPFCDTLAEQSLRSMATKAYVGGVIATGAALLIHFAPLHYPRPWLAVALLAAALILSAFKLRLPLGRGNSTMSMAYAVDFVALVSAGPDLAMVIAAAGVVLLGGVGAAVAYSILSNLSAEALANASAENAAAGSGGSSGSAAKASNPDEMETEA